MELTFSPKLEQILQQKSESVVDENAFSERCSSCTAGFNNDGSTGKEIFENGFELAVKANRIALQTNEPQEIWYAEYAYRRVGIKIFVYVIAPNEDEACKLVEAWQ